MEKYYFFLYFEVKKMSNNVIFCRKLYNIIFLFLLKNIIKKNRSPPSFIHKKMNGGDMKPKRRRSKDNPYYLNFDDTKKTYTVSFIDKCKNYQIVEINEDLYNLFNDFELKDLSQLNEYDNHIEHCELFENVLYEKSIKKEKLIDEIVEKNIQYERMYSCIRELPIIQKRRLIKYYFENKTFEEIAKEEHCSKRAVKFSVDIAIVKISKKMKN